jgi:alpha-N-arabinofuranosidase
MIVNGGSDLVKQPIWIEGPHLFRHDGLYYLCAAEGGTARDHSQVIFRSRDIDGPYEAFDRPILTQRHLRADRPNPVTCTGHADLVQTPAGDWWAVFLGSRCYDVTLTNLDRETFLLPVRWQDGWPIILSGDETVPRVLHRPSLPPQPPATTPHNGSFTWRDDFASKALSPAWNFLRTPRESWHSLRGKPGGLLIRPRPIDLSSRGNPSLIARRLQHHHFRASTLVSLSDDPRVDAGLVAFRNENHYFFLGTRLTSHGGGREIFLEYAAGKTTPGGPEIVARATLPAKTKAIELNMNGERRNYSFRYRTVGGDWINLKENADGSILSTDVAGGFVGTYLGMFARLRT